MVRNQERIDLSDLSNSQIGNLIDEWIHSERDRNILRRRLIDGLTFDELSEEFHLSHRQAQNIVYRSQKEFFKHLF